MPTSKLGANDDGRDSFQHFVTHLLPPKLELGTSSMDLKETSSMTAPCSDKIQMQPPIVGAEKTGSSILREKPVGQESPATRFRYHTTNFQGSEYERRVLLVADISHLEHLPRPSAFFLKGFLLSFPATTASASILKGSGVASLPAAQAA